jgi:hypothetical protein
MFLLHLGDLRNLRQKFFVLDVEGKKEEKSSGR